MIKEALTPEQIAAQYADIEKRRHAKAIELIKTAGFTPDDWGGLTPRIRRQIIDLATFAAALNEKDGQ